VFTPGLGLVYITETVNTQAPTTTIGSHINLMISAQLGLEVPLSSNTDLLIGGNFLHYSNGAIAVPNGGYNMLAGSLGVRTSLQKSDNPSNSAENYPHLERN